MIPDVNSLPSGENATGSLQHRSVIQPTVHINVDSSGTAPVSRRTIPSCTHRAFEEGRKTTQAVGMRASSVPRVQLSPAEISSILVHFVAAIFLCRFDILYRCIAPLAHFFDHGCISLIYIPEHTRDTCLSD